MAAYFEQPLRKLLGTLSPTITYLSEKGTIDVNSLPDEHLEAIKQLERIGVVHKRNNRLYELQKIRLRKLMDSMGISSLEAIAPQEMPVETMAPVVEAACELSVTTAEVVTQVEVIAPAPEPIVSPSTINTVEAS
jgi:predicted transcriptional regulator